MVCLQQKQFHHIFNRIVHTGEVALVKLNEGISSSPGSFDNLLSACMTQDLSELYLAANLKIFSPEWNVYSCSEVPHAGKTVTFWGAPGIYFLTQTFEIRAVERNNSPLIPPALRSFCSHFGSEKIISVANVVKTLSPVVRSHFALPDFWCYLYFLWLCVCVSENWMDLELKLKFSLTSLSASVSLSSL